MMTRDEKCIIMRDFNGHVETQCMALKAFIVFMADVNETEKMRRFWNWQTAFTWL